MNYKMQAVKFIKSFSRGQITIPKDIREKLGVAEEFWMKIFIVGERLVVEPIQTSRPKESYLKKLSNMKTDWFSEKDSEDYKKVRQEIEEHVEKYSL